RHRADRRHRPSRQPARPCRRRARREPVPHRARPHGARDQGADEPAGHRDADAAGAHQLQAGVRGDQGVLRLLAALAVHGPDEPPLRDHAQAPSLGPRPGRTHARARGLRGARCAPDALRSRVSVAASLIPFLENDDANRALMGSNMQRQAVPLLRTDAPLVGTGMERVVARDSGVTVVARRDGVVEQVDSTRIVVKADRPSQDGRDPGVDIYNLIKYQRSNQNTCINQRPIVVVGDHVKAGDVIADGPSTEMGELALGRNVLVAFMPWGGYNFEDSILISERVVKNDFFTSVHIEEFECVARDAKLRKDQQDEIRIIRESAGKKVLKLLQGKATTARLTDDTRKILLQKGVEIAPEVLAQVPSNYWGDIKVGDERVEDELSRLVEGMQEQIDLIKMVFNEKIERLKSGDELPPGVIKMVKVFVAIKRKLQVGDKMAGRHGNKGVLSRILPEEDMPYLA